MIGRAAEIFAIFRVKSTDFQRKSGFFGAFKLENLMIDNCFHALLRKNFVADATKGMLHTQRERVQVGSALGHRLGSEHIEE